MFSIEEQDEITKLKISNILVRLENRDHIRPLVEDAILLVCGDDRRALEKIRLILALAEKLNGSRLFRAFLLADYNPSIEYMVNPEYRAYLNKRIKKIRDDKGLKNIVLHGHGPCTHGLSLGLSLKGNMATTAKAAVMMDETHCRDEGTVQALYHTDPTDVVEDMRTYGFDVKKWDVYHGSTPALLSSTPMDILLPPR